MFGFDNIFVKHGRFIIAQMVQNIWSMNVIFVTQVGPEKVSHQPLQYIYAHQLQDLPILSQVV
jgi:hypothetical protein